MKKTLLAVVSAVLLITSNVYSEEQTFTLKIRDDDISFTQSSFTEALKPENMLKAFGGLSWTEGNLEKIIQALFSSGAKKVEVVSGGCAFKKYGNFFNAAFDSNESEAMKALMTESDKPCTINLTKSIPQSELIEKIATTDKKYLKLSQDFAKKYAERLYKFPIAIEGSGDEYIFDLATKKNKKLRTLSKILEINAEPIMLAGIPFKASFELEMNLLFLSKNKFSSTILTDKQGYSYPYLIKNISLKSLSKNIGFEELNKKLDSIYLSLKEKYPQFLVEGSEEFKDAINNKISFGGDALGKSSINYKSGFFDVATFLYVLIKKDLEKKAEKELYKNQKDSTNNL